MSEVFEIDYNAPLIAENVALWRLEQSLACTFHQTHDPKLATALGDISRARKSLAACVVEEGQEWDFHVSLALSQYLADFDAKGSA
jgi:hypothetical protein